MYKAIICDMDGTLLNSEHQISEYSKKIIGKVIDKGVKFFIATGRHHLDAVAFKKQLGLKTYMITSNGAKIHDENDNEIFSHNIPQEITKRILEFPTGDHIHRNVYKDDIWYTEKDLPIEDEFSPDSKFSYLKTNFADLKGGEITKAFFLCDDEDELLKFEEELITHFKGEVNIALSFYNCLEVMQRGVSKGHAIKEVLAKEGISLEETIAFGDGFNDYDMLKSVQKGCVMKNANYRLQKALSHLEVIDSNDNDGVAKKLAEIFLD